MTMKTFLRSAQACGNKFPVPVAMLWAAPTQLQPFLSSSLQSGKEKLVEKKIGVAISTELRSGFRKHCFRELLVKLFLPEPQVSGKKRFGPSPCRFATHCDSTAREMALRRFSLIAGGRND